MKYPWIQFFTGDWLKDPALSICSPATRGVWIDLLCAMHELDRAGELRGTHEQLARVARCLPADIAHALTELQTSGAADVTERNGVVTVVNRRMQQEAKAREGSKLRMRRMRGDGDVTPPLRDISHISEVRSQSTEGGESPPREGACAEIPTEGEAVAQVANAGIPPDFARFVFLDWSSRNGKDAAGIVIAWLPYVTRRWAKEQVEWRAKTHRGNKQAGPSPKREGVPTLSEVTAYAREKWGTDSRHTNWAASFYRSWNDPKRDWKRGGRLIDWKIELTSQVAKWRVENG